MTTTQHALLVRIFESPKCFDTRDYTFKISNRAIATHLKVSSRTVDRLMDHLRAKELTHTITDSRGILCNMLSPNLMYRHTHHWFRLGLFHLQDYDTTLKWIDDCWYMNCLIHPETGELLPLREGKGMSDYFDVSRQANKKVISYEIINEETPQNIPPKQPFKKV